MLSLGNGVVLFALIVTLAYFVGLLTYFIDGNEGKCEMTYMFEHPQFVRISNEFDKLFPKYGLYIYGEGPLTEKARNMFFDGIPVLFVHGNGGSYRQVRSLASVALRKNLDSRTAYHFDYFTVNLNEELSGLSGFLLNEQMDYVNQSLHAILNLYRNRKIQPTSVVLIGHSMGGVIIRKLVQQQLNIASIIITLASPHKRAPILLDKYLDEFYENMNATLPSNITFVSLTGGYSDLLVPTTLTDPKEENSIYTITTHIPRCWVPADHLSILWCKQVVMPLNKCMFGSVDPKTKLISSDSELRRAVFKHHLLHNSGINVHLKKHYSTPIYIRGKGEWKEALARQYSIRLLRGVKQLQWHMIKLVNDPKHEMLTVIGINLEFVDWVYACGAHIPQGKFRVCEEAYHLTHLSTISASTRYKRRSITINMHRLLKNNTDLTHIVLKALPTSEPVVFHVDVHKNTDRKVVARVPPIWSFATKTVLHKTEQRAITYEIYLPELEHVIQSYLLYLTPKQCTSENHHATATLMVPWSNEEVHKYFTRLSRQPFHIRLYQAKPFNIYQSAYIKLTLDPSCQYKISIKSSIRGSLGQLARFYSSLLLVNITSLILLTFQAQTKILSKGKNCLLIYTGFKEAIKPYHFLTSLIFSLLLSGLPLPDVIPKGDWTILVDEGIDFILLPYLIYIISIGIVFILCSSLIIFIALYESTIQKLFLRIISRTTSVPIKWSDYVMSVLQKVPFLVGGVLIVLSITACGGLALALGTIFYFLKLTQMAQQYIEQVVYTFVINIIKTYRSKIAIRTRNIINVRQNQTCDNNPATKREKNHIEQSRGLHSDVKNKSKTNGCENSAEKENNNKSRNLVSNETGDIIGDCNKEEVHISNIKYDSKNGEDIDLDIEESNYNGIFFHIPLFLIWTLVALINIPSVITWAHNFKYAAALKPDPSFLPGILFSFCSIPLWQLELPKTKKKWYREVGYVISFIVILSLIYAPVSIYRLNYFLMAVLVVIVLHQLFAPNVTHDKNEKRKKPDLLNEYDSLKTKLE